MHPVLPVPKGKMQIYLQLDQKPERFLCKEIRAKKKLIDLSGTLPLFVEKEGFSRKNLVLTTILKPKLDKRGM